jgi:hypothetical protein
MDHESGYAVIQWLQSWRNPVFDVFFIGITAFGTGSF